SGVSKESHMRLAFLPVLAVVIAAGACGPSGGSSSSSGTLDASGAANVNGAGGQMPAFYDGKQFTINFKELPAGGERATLAHNGSINTIYMSDTPLPDGSMFVAVLDAIQGDGFNPLWNEMDITFNTTPFQLTRDDDIIAAAKA